MRILIWYKKFILTAKKTSPKSYVHQDKWIKHHHHLLKITSKSNFEIITIMQIICIMSWLSHFPGHVWIISWWSGFPCLEAPDSPGPERVISQSSDLWQSEPWTYTLLSALSRQWHSWSRYCHWSSLPPFAINLHVITAIFNTLYYLHNPCDRADSWQGSWSRCVMHWTLIKWCTPGNRGLYTPGFFACRAP